MFCYFCLLMKSLKMLLKTKCFNLQKPFQNTYPIDGIKMSFGKEKINQVCLYILIESISETQLAG